MQLNDLEVYKLAREISDNVWQIYSRFEWQDKKIFGDQWVTSTDSIGANVAEGFGRYHYADKNKFNYNARGSLLESLHWAELAEERNKISKEELISLRDKLITLNHKLNSYIRTTKSQIPNNVQ